ncbi:tyrosine-type recombinase/integrase [Chroococcidiopsis sp. SAG 2025]|uniref:tyrosine-type recombinase/integrase n=1 Tax=Chroococcidiopsis sp. SAG 2025 TaxID=171389 RepID=UPI002936E06D|nr:tyrosine-type recombinase/integrase [Chroococcidiopsis sp. SAG 2025]
MNSPTVSSLPLPLEEQKYFGMLRQQSFRQSRASSPSITKSGQEPSSCNFAPFPVHAHMLRHGTGYYLANRGTDTRIIQSYLGHSNIQHTVRYTELVSSRFQGLWDG